MVKDKDKASSDASEVAKAAAVSESMDAECKRKASKQLQTKKDAKTRKKGDRDNGT